MISLQYRKVLMITSLGFIFGGKIFVSDATTLYCVCSAMIYRIVSGDVPIMYTPSYIYTYFTFDRDKVGLYLATRHAVLSWSVAAGHTGCRLLE